MRLFLLPISTRRTLLYCQRLEVATTERQGLVDRITARAAKLWANWEKQESGWQKRVVVYGNHALRRIPYEEWGLKSVPPLSTRRREEELRGETKIELVFPGSVIPTTKAETILQRLGTEREALHRRKLLWCVVGMPVTLPFALVPVIPNLPFFYLAYRAWSHWRAVKGGQHIQFLLENKLLSLAPSQQLDRIYSSKQLPDPKTGNKEASERPIDGVGEPPQRQEKPVEGGGNQARGEPEEPGEVGDKAQDAPTRSVDGDVLLLSAEKAKELAQAVDTPAVEAEVDRAVWQVQQSFKKMAKEAKKNA